MRGPAHAPRAAGGAGLYPPVAVRPRLRGARRRVGGGGPGGCRCHRGSAPLSSSSRPAGDSLRSSRTAPRPLLGAPLLCPCPGPDAARRVPPAVAPLRRDRARVPAAG